MNYWWVNQNQTYAYEKAGGFLWSPKLKKNGAANKFYDYMLEVQPGDLVFSFSGTYLKAVGIVMQHAEAAIKPDYGAANVWADDGWFVKIEFSEFDQPVRPKDHMNTLRPLLPTKYSPLQSNGDGLQAVYLTHVPNVMAEAIQAILGESYQRAVQKFAQLENLIVAREAPQDEAIQGRTDIGDTLKQQLTNARRGQGVFRGNVRLNEKACRITGITNPIHLVASHIKPWKDCDDVEKLHGCNGLLLAPHIDHLFDVGMISFADDGKMLVSSQLDTGILAAWGIPMELNVGEFNSAQRQFLAYHRAHCLKH
jgi:putative restriction endonuclease